VPKLGPRKNAHLGPGKVVVTGRVAVLNLVDQKVALAFNAALGFEKIRPVGEGVKNKTGVLPAAQQVKKPRGRRHAEKR
jgi:hypothetical protein